MTSAPDTSLIDERWTPNEALAALRRCHPDDCYWVWNSKSLADKEMSKYEAFRAAKEMQRDL